MKRSLALLAGLGLALVACDRAAAQAPSSGGAASAFNPFATFSLNRFSFNTLGFLQVESASPFVATSSPSAAGGELDEESIPQAVVIRPPFRPPVRSPYRPPPRPPF
jgi:hypothetical protein